MPDTHTDVDVGGWEKLHFSITGEFLTRHARNLMLEGNWLHALKTLAEGLCETTPEGTVGMTYEHCIAILDGYKRLEGTNEMDLVSEDPESTTEYRERLARLYGSIVKLTKGTNQRFTWYMPYAYVDSYGDDDIAATGHAFGHIERVSRSKQLLRRANHYVDDPDFDVVFYPGRDILFHELTEYQQDPCEVYLAFLFRPCEAPPFWFKVNTDAVKSLKNAHKTRRRLECRGAKQRGIVLCPWTKQALESPAILSDDIGNEVKATMLKKLVENTGVDIRAAASMISKMVDGADTSSKPEEDTIFENESGWILRDGRNFGCEYYQHPEMAMRILQHVFDVTSQDMPDDPQKDLEQRGALRVQKSADGFTVAFMLGLKASGMNWKPTKDQLKTVVDYCTKFNKPFPQDLLLS